MTSETHADNKSFEKHNEEEGRFLYWRSKDQEQ